MSVSHGFSDLWTASLGVSKQIGQIPEDVGALADLGILVDKDDEGYMLQIFTKSAQDLPTQFFKIIQWRGSRSVGEVLLIHVDDAVLDANGKLDPRKLKTIARLGGDYYCQTSDLFEMKRP